MPSYDVKEIGPAPIIGAICEQLGIRETINGLVPWDEKQCLLDPGIRVKALIINVLCGRTPLYQVKNSYREQDVELLFGKGVNIDHLNDDALAAVLDKIYAAGAKKVFHTVAFKAQAVEDIERNVLHGDTTSNLVYGAYEQEGGLHITRGYNKEQRKDLKQYKTGLVTTGEGFPLMAEILDGNLDDKTWNKQLLENLPEHFTLEELQKIIYIADSALITEDSLNLIAEKDIRFISHLPSTYNLSQELTEKAFAENCWGELGQIVPGKAKAFYKVQEFRENLYGRSYRFLVIHSSHLDKRKLKGLQSRVKKEKEELEKNAKKLMKQAFACEPDAQDALLRFIKEKGGSFYPLTGSVEYTRERVKRSKRGRPSQEEVLEYQDVYRINLQIGELDEKALEKEKEKLSCFVLISNIFQGYNARQLLKEYKEQNVVENRFKFVKHPLYVGPLYLQSKERLEALSYVILMALVVYITLQRRMRLALEKENEPLMLVGDKKSFVPTGNRVLEMFRPVKVVLVKEGDTVKRYLPERYSELKRALNLIGFDMDIFIKPRAPD